MTNPTMRRVAVLAACTAWAMTSVGCDLGEPPQTFPGLAVVGTGDVDGDGNLDFVTIDSPYALEGLTVRLGDGTGSFPSSQHVPMRFAHCTVGRDCAGFDHVYLEDFTGDGVVDLALEATRRYPGRPGDDAMELRVNDGAGRFGEPVVIHPSDADWWGDFGDVTGDGLPDMIRMDSPGPGGPVQIVTQRNDGSSGFGPDKLDDWSRIVFGDGAGGFGPARATGGARATVADFDADGRPDYVASTWSCDCALPDRIEVHERLERSPAVTGQAAGHRGSAWATTQASSTTSRVSRRTRCPAHGLCWGSPVTGQSPAP